jgi:hypothetical protein
MNLFAQETHKSSVTTPVVRGKSATRQEEQRPESPMFSPGRGKRLSCNLTLHIGLSKFNLVGILPGENLRVK